MTETAKQTALRIRPSDLARIDKLAKARGMNRSEYMIWAALQDHPGPLTTQQRFEALERKLQSLEDRLQGRAAETP